jgi:hypothetical protein
MPTDSPWGDPTPLGRVAISTIAVQRTIAKIARTAVDEVKNAKWCGGGWFTLLGGSFKLPFNLGKGSIYLVGSN